MTVNAIAFYAVAALIVLAAAAAVGLTSLRLAAYAGGAVVVFMAVLELISGAYGLAVVQVVVPGIAAAVVMLVLRHDDYRGLGAAPEERGRWWFAGPVALGIGALFVVTLAIVGDTGWDRIPVGAGQVLPAYRGAAVVTVLHYRAPYALVIVAVMIVVTVAAGLVIGRRSADEHALDRHIETQREREERARKRREDREQGRRRSGGEPT